MTPKPTCPVCGKNYSGKWITNTVGQRVNLANRELEVCKLIAVGLKHNDVADKLGIHSKTVSTHFVHSCGKLKVTNEVELAHLFLERKIVSNLNKNRK